MSEEYEQERAELEHAARQKSLTTWGLLLLAPGLAAGGFIPCIGFVLEVMVSLSWTDSVQVIRMVSIAAIFPGAWWIGYAMRRIARLSGTPFGRAKAAVTFLIVALVNVCTAVIVGGPTSELLKHLK